VLSGEDDAAAVGDSDAPAVLAARIAAGERKAEARLVERYGRAVALILERHTRGRAEAEDLFQDTFRTALEKLRRGELREPAKLPGFLAAIARNLAIEHYRKLGRRRTEPDSDGLQAVASPVPSPLDLLVTRDNVAVVHRLLVELRNPRDRELLLRFYVADEDRERIAADYGLSNLQFNRVLHRARQRYKLLVLARREAAGAGARLAVVALAAMGAAVASPWR
jgi:RNA polymerase sigma-70 factor (ECF subfamily)